MTQTEEQLDRTQTLSSENILQRIETHYQNIERGELMLTALADFVALQIAQNAERTSFEAWTSNDSGSSEYKLQFRTFTNAAGELNVVQETIRQRKQTPEGKTYENGLNAASGLHLDLQEALENEGFKGDANREALQKLDVLAQS